PTNAKFRSHMRALQDVGAGDSVGVAVGVTVRVRPLTGVFVGCNARIVTSTLSFGSRALISDLVTDARSVTLNFPEPNPLSGAITLMSSAVSVSRIGWGPVRITLTRSGCIVIV